VTIADAAELATSTHFAIIPTPAVLQTPPDNMTAAS